MKKDSRSLPLLLLALFGFFIALWMRLQKRSERNLYPLVECTEHVNSEGIGSDWEIFSLAPLVDKNYAGAGVVRHSLKKNHTIVSRTLIENVAIARRQLGTGLETRADFELDGKKAQIFSSSAEKPSSLTLDSTSVELRCFQLEP